MKVNIELDGQWIAFVNEDHVDSAIDNLELDFGELEEDYTSWDTGLVRLSTKEG